jgi:hypothetical protein
MIGIFLGVLPIPQGCGTNVLAPYTKRSAGIQAMTKTRSTVLQCAVILAAFVASAARADLKDENLLVTAPPGYKVGFSDKKPDMLMTEFVPAKETVENWTEMVTVQVFFGLKATPQQFMDDMANRWRAACPDAKEAHTVADAPENGYPTLVRLLSCPKNPGTGKPEFTWFKAVQGNDSFYLVQKAFNSSRAKSRSRAGWAISER